MFSGKNKKNSILLILLVALLAAATSLFGLSAFAEITDPTGDFAYIENGETVYSTVSSGNYDDKAELLAKLENVSVLSKAYAEEIKTSSDSWPVDVAFEKLDLYLQLIGAVDEYNAYLSEKGYSQNLAVGVKDEFVYPRVGIEPAETVASDISTAVKEKAISQIRTSALNWKDATESEYVLKYFLQDEQGYTLFEIYVATSGEPLIVEKEGAEIVKSNAKGLVQDLVFTVNGTEYSITVSVAIKNGINPDTFTQTKDYTVTVFTIKDASGTVIYDKNSTSAAMFTAVVDEEYKSYTESVNDILLKANEYFKNPVLAEMKAKYEEYNGAIAAKIGAVKAVVADRLEAVASSRSEWLFDADVYAEITATLEEGVFAVNGAASYSALDGIYEDYKARIEALKTIPEEIREAYADLLVENKNYQNGGADSDFARAFEAIARIDNVGSEAYNELAGERAILLANVTRSAEKEINALAESFNTESLAGNQIREIAKNRNEAIAAVKAAGDDDEAIKAAVESFTSYINGVNFKTKTELTADRITITGVFDEGTTLSSTLTTVTEDTSEQLIQSIEDVKKASGSTRLTNALEVFDITLYLDGNKLDYNDDKGYTVKIELDSATLELFKTGGIDRKSVVVAYVEDGATKPAIYDTTLMLYDGNGNVVYDSTSTENIAGVEWDKIAEGTIMFTTQHFSSYYLMGNTSNLAIVRLTNLLAGLADSDALTYVLIGLGVLIGIILLVILVSFIVSLCIRYKIRFESNGGTSVKTIKRKYGSKLPTFRVPTKKGYVFDGWCIDPTLKYEFNRTVMPRANVTLYARWVEDVEAPVAEQQEELKKRVVGYYDKLRVKLAACKKPIVEGEKSFVEKEILAKLFAEDDHVKLLVKTVKSYIKDENGIAYIIEDDAKFTETVVSDELSFDLAVTSIEAMAKEYGMVIGDEPEISETSYEDAVLGYAYVINYNEIADFDERYCALRSYALTFALTDESKAENGKVVFELIPDRMAQTLTLGYSLDMAKYSNILTEKSISTLGNVYEVKTGEDMGVALELIERALNENGFTVSGSQEVNTEFSTDETYQFIITLAVEEPAEEVVEEVEEVVEVVEEVVEEPVDLNAMFNSYRSYVCSFALFAEEEEIDRSNDGLLIVKAKLYDDEIRTTIDPECDAEAFSFNTNEGFETAKEKVNAVMAKYGFEFSEEASVEELELGEEESFGYRIAFPPIMTAEEMLAEIRNYANSFAMFIDEDAEVDTTYDGTVVVKAAIKDETVVVTVDPDAEAQEIIVAKEEDLVDAKFAITTVMAKYGMELDGEYTPAEDAATGTSFGFKIKFD